MLHVQHVCSNGNTFPDVFSVQHGESGERKTEVKQLLLIIILDLGREVIFL